MLGANSRYIKKATEDDCTTKFGFQPGYIPPFGFLEPAKVYMETGVLPSTQNWSIVRGRIDLTSDMQGVRSLAAEASDHTSEGLHLAS